MSALDRMKSLPLYDVAVEEIRGVIPPDVTETTAVTLEGVRLLMAACWLRGVEWAREQADSASDAKK